MSAVVERPELKEAEWTAAARTWTAADLAVLPSELPSGPACGELWNGAVRLGLVPDVNHGSVCAEFGAALWLWVEQGGRGRVWARTGVVLASRPATVFGPDVSLATAGQLPVKVSPEDWLLTVPALIVEVRALMESAAELGRKARRYLEAGARLVWLADPESRTVTAYGSGQDPYVFAVGEELTAGQLLPGFSWPIERVFSGTVELASTTESHRRMPGSGTVLQWSEADQGLVRRRFWTLADMAALPSQLPTGPALYELWDGELRLMPPLAEVHGNLENRLGGILLFYGEWEGHGRSSCGEVGIVINAVQDTVFGADAVFLSSDQLPARHCERGFLLTMPAIVVEVRSKNDSMPQIRKKARRYLEAGVRLVWVADQRRRTLAVYRSGEAPQVLTEEDLLTAEGILPNLAFPIRRLFEGLD